MPGAGSELSTPNAIADGEVTPQQLLEARPHLRLEGPLGTFFLREDSTKPPKPAKKPTITYTLRRIPLTFRPESRAASSSATSPAGVAPV